MSKTLLSVNLVAPGLAELVILGHELVLIVNLFRLTDLLYLKLIVLGGFAAEDIFDLVCCVFV